MINEYCKKVFINIFLFSYFFIYIFCITFTISFYFSFVISLSAVCNRILFPSTRDGKRLKRTATWTAPVIPQSREQQQHQRKILRPPQSPRWTLTRPSATWWPWRGSSGWNWVRTSASSDFTPHSAASTPFQRF